MENTLDSPTGNNPENIPLVSYIIVLVLSAWGGTVHFVRRVQANKGLRFSLAELVGEITISSFVGVMIFLLCEAEHVSRIISAALVGISGNMGARLLYRLEVIATRKILGPYTRFEDDNLGRRKFDSIDSGEK